MKKGFIVLMVIALLAVCSSLMAASITWSVTASPVNSATISVTANGQAITSPAKFVVQAGTSINIPNVTTAAGYYFDSAKKDGKLAYESDLPFIADTKSHKVILYFKKNPVITASTSPKSGGTITPLGKVSVEYESNQEFIIEAKAGYEVKSLKVNGKYVSPPLDTYTFTNVIKANTIAATFTVKSYTITSSVSGGHGKISPLGTKKVNHGSSLSYTATPDKGYSAEIYVDGTAVATGLESKSLKYTLTNITSSNVVESKFVQASVVLVTGVTLNKTTLPLNKGTSETLAATVNPSNAVNKNVTWSSNNNAVATVDTNGKVTAVGDGTCTVTVTTVDGGFKSACVVTINTQDADKTAISALYQSVKTALESHNVDATMALFSPNYIHNGADFATTKSNIQDGVSKVKTVTYNITNITVTGNTAIVTASISVTFDGQSPSTWTEPSNGNEGLGMGWIVKENGKWLFNGNQKSVVVSISTTNSTDDWWSIGASVSKNNKITSVTVEGPQWIKTNLESSDPSEGPHGSVQILQIPTIGDVYTFDITFSDGHHEILTDMVKGFINVRPTLTVETVGSTSINFSWTNINDLVPNIHDYGIAVEKYFVPGTHNKVRIWRSQDYPTTRFLTTFNEDGTASEPLQSGLTYLCMLVVYDIYGNSTCAFVDVTIP